jgi:hypothetical protein
VAGDACIGTALDVQLNGTSFINTSLGDAFGDSRLCSSLQQALLSAAVLKLARVCCYAGDGGGV